MNRTRTLLPMILLGGTSLAGVPAFAQPNGQPVDLLPLLEVSREAESPHPVQSPVGGYVRFWIEREGAGPATPSAPDRAYSDERRTWFNRFLVGRNRARILTARLVVNRANVVTQTVTLASTTHDSNRRQGESWTSELGERRFLTPFFRVDQGTTASIEIALSASARIDPDITRNLLSIIERGARLAAPKAPLVTALNASRITETSDFIDSSVSRLFGEAVAERSHNDFSAEGWYRGATPLATVAAQFPMGGHVWTGPDTRDLGEWNIRVSEPIVSIFSPTPLHADVPAADSPQAVCLTAPGKAASGNVAAVAGEALAPQDRQGCLAFMGLTPSRVLGLSVGENITLGQALRGDTGISAALQRFANAANKSEAAGEAAREICVLVAERAEALGLNPYDAAAAMWAFASNGGIATEVSRGLWTGTCTVSRLAQRLHLNLETDSAAPAETASGGGNGGNGSGGNGS